MFVVLDNSKRTHAETWILHLKLSHISIQHRITMAFTLFCHLWQGVAAPLKDINYRDIRRELLLSSQETVPS